ncbi:MAG: cysteine hydrolase [Actinobacteria bacterium]|nr:cysteine hydrolase [Actinomycetota bacterium]MBV8597270.1 cysteine hydrolase [Actinomycetota bacterium]
MKDALLVVDVFNDFDHDDGEQLRSSFHERLPAMEAAISLARVRDVPVVYVNDQRSWDGDAPRLVREAIAVTPELACLEPQPGDPFILKARYSAFDHTTLEILLREREVDRVLIIGSSTEGCVVQTGIDARELGFKVTILCDACATTDAELEDVALRYAEDVGGMRVSRAGSLRANAY